MKHFLESRQQAISELSVADNAYTAAMRSWRIAMQRTEEQTGIRAEFFAFMDRVHPYLPDPKIVLFRQDDPPQPRGFDRLRRAMSKEKPEPRGTHYYYVHADEKGRSLKEFYMTDISPKYPTPADFIPESVDPVFFGISRVKRLTSLQAQDLSQDTFEPHPLLKEIAGIEFQRAESPGKIPLDLATIDMIALAVRKYMEDDLNEEGHREVRHFDSEIFFAREQLEKSLQEPSENSTREARSAFEGMKSTRDALGRLNVAAMQRNPHAFANSPLIKLPQIDSRWVYYYDRADNQLKAVPPPVWAIYKIRAGSESEREYLRKASIKEPNLILYWVADYIRDQLVK